MKAAFPMGPDCVGGEDARDFLMASSRQTSRWCAWPRRLARWTPQGKISRFLITEAPAGHGGGFRSTRRGAAGAGASDKLGF